MKKGQVKKWIKPSLISIGAIGLLHVVVIVFYGMFRFPKPADYLIVLGTKVELNGQPSTRLQYRLDKGLKLYQAGIAPRIIVSGGIGKEGFDESRVMADYLIAKGVPATDIVRDSLGLTTFASAQNSLTIMQAQQATSIVVVSQYFHLLRSHLAFHRMGIFQVQVASTEGLFEWRDIYSTLREIPGIYYYLFRSYP